MKFTSKSAIESPSSANWSLKASRAVGPSKPLVCELRKDVRDEGRSGVVGRETGDRDRARDNGRVWEAARWCDMMQRTWALSQLHRGH